VNWIKDFFSTDDFFELDNKKEYELEELIQILKHKKLTMGTGNSIVLKILEELVKKHEK
jgi:hypothetical protein